MPRGIKTTHIVKDSSAYSRLYMYVDVDYKPMGMPIFLKAVQNITFTSKVTIGFIAKNTADSVNPVTLGTVQLGRNSEVAVFQEIAAA